MKQYKIGFICVHNSCRSQMAEAITKLKYSDRLIAYSAGTHTKPQINQDAVRLVKQRYGVDMNETQYSKTLTEIPPLDIVVTMGCEVDCPYLPSQLRLDFGLEDPTGKDDAFFYQTMDLIESKLLALLKQIDTLETK